MNHKTKNQLQPCPTIPTFAIINYESRTGNVFCSNQVFFSENSRSFASGMNIYLNGQEQPVTVTAGVANPPGSIVRPNEIYIGHDSITLIDELQISNMVEPSVQPLWMQWWVWAIISIGIGSGIIIIHKKYN